MNWFARSRSRFHKPIRRNNLLRVEHLEARAVPAAFDPQCIAVGFYTGDPTDPVVARAVPVAAGQTVDQAVAQWRQSPAVAYAEPNYTIGTSLMPNDTYTSLLYGQNNTGQSGGTADADMDAAEAWNLTTGSLQTTVAVIDTGVDYTHPDLYKNIWINQAEIPAAIRAALTDVDADGRITFWDLNSSVNIGAGKITDLNGTGYIDGGDILKPTSAGGWADAVDSGSNGYVDDLVGWDYVGNDNDPMDVLAEEGGHGTHVAGTIGAVGNNGTGVAGVAWQTQLMALRFIGAGGGDSVAGANAIRYSAANGAVVSNNSWGSTGYSQAIYDAISYARTKGQVFVAAAGNAGTDNDAAGFYPANFALDNVVAVAATDRNDQLASWSNYGRSTVDLAAAGVDIASTYPGADYVYMSGTSMATPQVAGAFALLRSRDPSLTYAQAIGRILNNVDPVPALAGKTATGGRLNVHSALVAGTTDATGAYVTGMTPNATGTSPVSAVRLTFSEPVNATTFTAADVTVTGPSGAAVTVTGVTPVGTGGTQFDVTFASQSATGTYTVRVGPAVADLAGNLMNQDRDAVNGEATQDRFTGTFTVSAPYTTTTFTNAQPAYIYDNLMLVSRLYVGQDITIADLNVVANILHPNVSDLTIAVRGPDGTVVSLFNRRGGTGDNLTGTTFNDEAATGIAVGAAPFTGSFRPEAALSAFDGKNARGYWELWVTDHARYNTGQLRNWSLVVTSGSPNSGQSTQALDVRPLAAGAGERRAAVPAWLDAAPVRPAAPAVAAPDWGVYVGRPDAAADDVAALGGLARARR